MNVLRNPFEEYFTSVLKRAAELEASDIHIEPFKSDITIKMRVDSRLRVHDKQTDPEFIRRLHEVIKKQCRFDMGVFGVPQDSRFTIDGIPFDYRASLCPTMHGEKIVLRLLEKNKIFNLKNYQLRPDAKTDLYNALGKWQGLIIVSGPTGSGKSTLLYSALGTIDRIENNVHTIENPIEYSLPNLNQSEAILGKLSFADITRSLLRQDPDVILIGEIRDEETAEAAIHAASTGHLVLTTVHANSALEITDRLEGLGIRKDLFVANLLFASAQRLVPKNCPHCLEDDPEHADLVRAIFKNDVLPKRSRGCDKCNGGTKGRVLLFEWMTREKDDSGKYRTRFHDSIANEALKYLREGLIDASAACGLE
jgi:type II secretory ATPase GspE/PulE/Tfp pilus assembly ATPase PilB-like protein